MVMNEFLHLTKALADENRVRLLLALRRGELCACQLTELLRLAPSTVSKHLFLLKHAGLLESRKDGRWIYFKLAGRGAPVVVREAMDWVNKSLGRSATALADAKRLKAILKEDPSELCKRLCNN
jgi:ArsR family transcriptional regulator